MKKQVLVISTSLRIGSNSDILADEFVNGAIAAGHFVEKLSLMDQTLQFCKGCLACQNTKTGHCVMQDDADRIVTKMAKADVIVFATPVYFYEMSGQMKTLLDRTNPLFPIDYRFQDIYLLATAAEENKTAMDGAIKGLTGWIDCFEQARLAGVVYGIGADDATSILHHEAVLKEAYEFGNLL